MQLLKILLLSLFVGLANAADEFTFSLYEVALPDLARVILDDVAQSSVIVANEVVKDREPLNFVLRKVTKAQAIDQFQHLAKSRGFELVKVHDVYHLRKAVEVESDFFVYIPKHRSVSYLSDLVSGVIPRTAIATQRALPYQPQQQNIQAPGQQLQQSTMNESGVNSMLDRGDKDLLLIKAKPNDLVIVKKMLAQVDRPIAEISVKAVIMEVQTGSVEASAVNLLAKLVASGVGSASLNYNGGADGKNGITVKVGGIDAIWSAINSDSRFRVVSAPQIRVKSGSSARFSVGSDTPVLGAVNYQGNGQSVQSVEYKPSGVILELKPEIRGDIVDLKIMQQLSSFAKTETGVNGSPTLLKRELSTSVIVGQNDVVMLGGLDEQKSNNDGYGLIFLPEFMRSNSASRSRSEIVLMLYVERIQSGGVAM